MDMMTWWAALPRLVLMVAVLFLPGCVAARLLGLRGSLAWALGPLVAAASAGVGSVVCAALGIRWNGVAMAVVLGMVTALCAALGRSGGRGTGGLADLRVGASTWWHGREARALAVVLPLAWVASTAPVIARSTPDAPIQQYDPVFHMNALWLVLRDGNASSFGGLTRMFGMDTTPATVPAGWHALVAPFASSASIVETVNVFSLVVPLVWMTGLLALTRVLLPGRPGVAVLTVALAPLVVEFPTYVLTKYPAWPNALALALVPALIALGVSILSRGRGVPTRRFLADEGGRIVLFVFLLTGACLVHPAAGLSLLVLGVPAVLVLLARRWTRLVRVRRGGLAAREVLLGASGLAAVWIGVGLVPGLQEKLSGMTDAYRTEPNVDWYNPLKALVIWPIVDMQAPVTLVEVQLVVAVVVASLTLVGLVSCLRSRAGQVLLAAWVGAWLLTLTTLMRSGPLLPLAGLWYMSTHRAMAVQAVVQLPVMALGAQVLWGLVSGTSRPASVVSARHRRTRDLLLPVAVVVTLVGGAATAPSRADLTWRVYSLRSPFVSVMLTDATEDLASRADQLLPQDAVVLGDPFNGSAYLQVLGDREVVFPQLYFRESNLDEEYLRLHFSDITGDPRVCSILRDRGIGYAWTDTNSWHAGEDQALVSPGLYGVDVGDGFEVLATAGTVSLVRITACG